MAVTEPELTAERVKRFLDYDQETGEFRWKLQKNPRGPVGSIAGCINKTVGYRYIRMDGRMYAAHRLAWLYVYGEWPRDVIDHIDRDPQNNAIRNLRQATRSQNAINKKIKGICQLYDGKWQAKIQVRGRQIYLGRFSTPEAASAAYRAAAIKHFGEFAEDRSVLALRSVIQGQLKKEMIDERRDRTQQKRTA